MAEAAKRLSDSELFYARPSAPLYWKTHHCGDTAISLGPRHRQFLNCAITEFELVETCFNDRLELAGVLMTSVALAPAIDVGTLGRISGVRPDLTILQYDFDHHTLVYQRQVYSSDRLRGLQPKKLLIQRGVLHTIFDSFEKLESLAVSNKSQ